VSSSGTVGLTRVSVCLSVCVCVSVSVSWAVCWSMCMTYPGQHSWVDPKPQLRVRGFHREVAPPPPPLPLLAATVPVFSLYLYLPQRGSERNEAPAVENCTCCARTIPIPAHDGLTRNCTAYYVRLVSRTSWYTYVWSRSSDPVSDLGRRRPSSTFDRGVVPDRHTHSRRRPAQQSSGAGATRRREKHCIVFI